MGSSGTILITGANGGLGSAFIKALINSSYSSSYRGVFTVRSASPDSSGGLHQIVDGTSLDYSITPLDLSDLNSVRTFAKSINDKVASGEIPRIRALVLNAAIQTHRGPMYSKDNLEINFAVNYLAKFLLVLLLLQSMDLEWGRIVIVSSFTHDPAVSYNSSFAKEKLMWKDVETMARQHVDDKGDEWAAGMRRYARSKLLMLMFM
jgi:NAD(P)-dependent dehydrogenase (short-subunit alcohol dehydrogenase family)